MKNVFVAFVALIAATTAVQAQKHATFGLKGGVNIATLKLEDSNADLDPRIGLHAGGLVHVHLNRNWAIQPELVYSAQGFKDLNNSDVKWKLDYINVPVMVQYMFDNGFRLETGPQLGFLVNAKAESGSTTQDIKDDLKGTDVSWGFGLGYLTSSQVGIGARYNLGLTDINESGGSNTVKNRVFQISLFYQFDKAHK